MSTEIRWQRLQDLFHTACELPIDAREDFARKQAADDPALLDELLAMLLIESSATSKVNDSMRPMRDLLHASQTLPPGTRFGPWALIEPIGHGGMGQVYLARRADGAYERKVALKVMDAIGLAPAQYAFFEVERQLLAQMQHPAIAQIHDGGTDAQGRPWLAMEYIKGERITDFCDQRTLSLRRRIELFLRLCDGVQHAHQKGVVHRDIKPGNVLGHEINGVPTPCLIDFGIAIGAGEENRPAGTPGYMSPEQADPTQHVDSRCDIYSLGGLLYELIIGVRPPATPEHDSESSSPSRHLATLDPEQIQTLAERRGLAPKHLLLTLREDLDWVIAKAMEPNPDQRYQSVSLLANDLTRFLAGYPVSAAPPRRIVAAQKFVSRHRIGVFTAALVLMSLIGGLMSTSWALHQAKLESQRKQITADFLSSILSSVDPDFSGEMDKTLMLHVLDDAAQRIEVEMADDPDGRSDIQRTIAESYTALGMPRKAIPLLESTKATVRAKNGAGIGSVEDLLTAQRLGSALVDAGRFEESEQVFREAIESGSSAKRRVPEGMVADMRSRLSWTLRQRGKMDDALAEARRAYAELVAKAPEDDPQRLDAGGRLAILLSDAGHYDEAIALIRDMIARRTEQLGADHPRTLAWRLSLAVFYLQKRDYAAGEMVLKAMLGPVAKKYGENSSMLAMVHNNLGGALRQQGKVEEAGPHYRFAYEFNLSHNGPEAPNTFMARHNLANWLLDDGQIQKAYEEQVACLEISERIFGADHNVTSEILRGLGMAQLALGELDDARLSLERSLRIKTEIYGNAEGPLARLHENLAQLEAAEQAEHAETLGAIPKL